MSWTPRLVSASQERHCCMELYICFLFLRSFIFSRTYNSKSQQRGRKNLRPKPSVAAWQRYDTFISEQFSVVTFYRLAISSVAWTTSLYCRIFSATLVGSALYHVTRPKLAEKHTNTVGTTHTPHPVAWRSSDWFSPKLHEKRDLL
jgi:hypothetical protein